MTNTAATPTVQLDAGLTVPYLDQWLGTWFIEPERGRALHSAIRQLNIGMHLQQRQATHAQPAATAAATGQESYRAPVRYRSYRDELEAKNPDGQPVAIDWEQAPPTRGAYAYRVIDGVAVLELNGSLMKHEASATESTSTVMMRRSVRKLMADGQVKAVIFQVDSPGGTVAGIYELATDIAALAKVKPVHAHAANLCASAAYLLASQMRSISATASSLVGSLGTYGVVYDLSEMAAKEGVKVHLLKGRINGKDALMKGAGTPGTEISAEQLARMQEGVDDLNQQFYDAVLAGPRKPKAAAVEAWFTDAGVWVAAKAKAMGLIDRVESFDDMLARVSGEAKNGARDTTPGTTNKPAGDDTPGNGRRSDAAAGGLNESPAQDAGTSPAAAAAAPQPEEADMSEKTTPAAPATPSDAAPKSATLDELRAACPGAGNDFLVEAMDKKMTAAQATSSFIEFQSTQIKARDVELTKLRAAAPAAPAAEAKPAADAKPAEQPAAAATKKPGVPALSSTAAEQQGPAGAAGDPVAAFIDRRDALCKEKGLTRAQAVMRIAAEEPDLHKAYIGAANGKRS